MFGSLGMPEILFILVLALLVFGPKRLPELGKTLGRGLREFRRATTDLKRTVESEMEAADDDRPRPFPPVQSAAPREVAPEETSGAAGAVPRDPPAAVASTADGEPASSPDAAGPEAVEPAAAETVDPRVAE